MWIGKRLSLIVLAILLGGCSRGVPESPRSRVRSYSIGTLAAPEPADTQVQTIQPPLVDQAISVKGTVQQSAPLLDRWLYQLSDTSGTLWILSSDSPPAPGEMVRVQGIVRYEQILIGGTDQGEYYLEETQRRTSK